MSKRRIPAAERRKTARARVRYCSLMAVADTLSVATAVVGQLHADATAVAALVRMANAGVALRKALLRGDTDAVVGALNSATAAVVAWREAIAP